jgi:hypothetical protein
MASRDRLRAAVMDRTDIVDLRFELGVTIAVHHSPAAGGPRMWRAVGPFRPGSPARQLRVRRCYERDPGHHKTSHETRNAAARHHP